MGSVPLKFVVKYVQCTVRGYVRHKYGSDCGAILYPIIKGTLMTDQKGGGDKLVVVNYSRNLLHTLSEI